MSSFLPCPNCGNKMSSPRMVSCCGEPPDVRGWWDTYQDTLSQPDGYLGETEADFHDSFLD